MNAWAHTAEDKPWEALDVHLTEVGRLSESFAQTFDAGDWGKLAGLWHDLGQYSKEFQEYLQSSSQADSHYSERVGKIDHTSAGAQWAFQKYSTAGLILAYLIAGHHAGLLDFSAEAGKAGLENRLKKNIPEWLANAPADLLNQAQPSIPRLGTVEQPRAAAFRVAFWIRMLYSCLVDADFLATESFMNPDKSRLRPSTMSLLPKMTEILDQHLSKITFSAKKTPINSIRADILEACRNESCNRPGFFELCVPTGGGKTLSSLCFGLNHALHNELNRVVVAVPFTSIIEQNAAVYRGIFEHLGNQTVVEHHSNVDLENETSTNRLQSENWDAPLVVTTNVQLFESLFANKSSRCRKIHRLAKSVIILDEVQSLPVDLLEPTLLALKELVELYGTTVVLCSATQPAFAYRNDFPIGFKDIHPIIENASSLYDSMRRTTVRTEGVLDNDELADKLLQNHHALCIVNTRAHAAELSLLLGNDDGHIHLSTRMCAQHRLEEIQRIHTRLKEGKTCRVVSTQLIEAGVDLDFPVVYRARCGLDSLAQAAGRCTREGLLKSGAVVFFAATTLPPPGFLRQSAQAAEELMGAYKDPLSPDAIEAYFRRHYWLNSDRWDHEKVLDTVGNKPDTVRFQFAEMSARYRFIKDDGHAVFVPWGDEGRKLYRRLAGPMSPGREIWRKIQRFCVQIREDERRELEKEGVLNLCHERWVLTDMNKYDERLGMVTDKRRSCEDYIV